MKVTDWAFAIQSAQLLYGVIWMLVVICSMPAASRFFRAGFTADRFGGVLRVLLGLLQAGFVVRWYVWRPPVTMMEPTEVSTWLGLYVAGAALGIAYMAVALFRKA